MPFDTGYNQFYTRQIQLQIQTSEEVETEVGVGAITGLSIARNTIRADNVVVGLTTWSTNVTWSTSPSTVSWNAHTLFLSDGTQVSITAGSATLTTAGTRYYLYWEKGSSTYTLTSNFDAAISNDRILINKAQKDSNNIVTMFPSSGTGTIISGNDVRTGKVQSNSGLTYFDLDNGKIIINNGTSDIIGIGNF